MGREGVGVRLCFGGEFPIPSVPFSAAPAWLPVHMTNLLGSTAYWRGKGGNDKSPAPLLPMGTLN